MNSDAAKDDKCEGGNWPAPTLDSDAGSARAFDGHIIVTIGIALLNHLFDGSVDGPFADRLMIL